MANTKYILKFKKKRISKISPLAISLSSIISLNLGHFTDLFGQRWDEGKASIAWKTFERSFRAPGLNFLFLGKAWLDRVETEDGEEPEFPGRAFMARKAYNSPRGLQDSFLQPWRRSSRVRSNQIEYWLNFVKRSLWKRFFGNFII